MSETILSQSDKPYLIGVDVGGTKVEVALLQKKSDGELTLSHSGRSQKEKFSVCHKKRILTERALGYENVVHRISGLIESTVADAGIDSTEVASVGFGLPGSIHPKTNKMTNGNTRILIGQDIASDIKTHLQWDTTFLSENDANCFALAEALCGAGVKYQKEEGKKCDESVVIGIILGTGCGGGIVLNGQLLRGKDGGAGEIGHMVFDPEGPPCYCGRRGCPEQYLSGPGVEALFATRRYSQVQDVHSTKEIFEKAEENEPVAVAVVKEYRKTLGRFLGSLSSVFNPDYFVLGGGVSRQKLIYHELEKELAAHTYTPSNSVKIYQSCLGDSSGVLGAAFLPFIR